jgi:hypothetical protein
MNIYSNNNPSRTNLLFYKNICNITGVVSMNLFNPDNIYEIILHYKPKYLLLDNYVLSNYHIQNCINDIIQKNLITNTKIVLLNTENTNNIKNENFVFISTNDYLLYDEYPNTSNNQTTSNSSYILCNMSCLEAPDMIGSLNKLFYPENTTMPVKLINNPKVEHVQNLGVASEDKILNLIKQCAYYINIDNLYYVDALMMKKPVINLISNQLLSVKKPDTIDTIDSCSFRVENLSIDSNKFISNITKQLGLSV